MIKAIIFDLDGTLLNTISDLNNTVNLTYKYFNIEKENTIKDTMSMVGHGIKNLVSQMFNDYPSLIEDAYLKFLEIYNDEYYKATIPYDGIKEMIDTLTSMNIKVGVNSNKNDSYTKKLIELHFNNINLDYVLGKREDIKIKPDPEGVNFIINKMNVSKDEVLYVGDSDTDIKTAINAGIKYLSVTWGFRSKDELVKANGKDFVDSPNEVINYIKGIL